MLYAQWRYRGIDPYLYMRGEGAPPPTSHRYEALLAGFAVYAARMDEAVSRGLGGLGG